MPCFSTHSPNPCASPKTLSWWSPFPNATLENTQPLTRPDNLASNDFNHSFLNQSFCILC